MFFFVFVAERLEKSKGMKSKIFSRCSYLDRETTGSKGRANAKFQEGPGGETG